LRKNANFLKIRVKKIALLRGGNLAGSQDLKMKRALKASFIRSLCDLLEMNS